MERLSISLDEGSLDIIKKYLPKYKGSKADLIRRALENLKEHEEIQERVPFEDIGIYLDFLSDYNTISGNTANYNEYGIFLDRSNYNTVSGNSLLGNEVCIAEKNCEGNVFENNDCGQDQGIPGYNLFFLLGIVSVGSIILIKKLKKY